MLTRVQRPTSVARLYVFAVGGSNDGWLPSFVELASTRAGRLALRGALTEWQDRTTSASRSDPGRNTIAKAG